MLQLAKTLIAGTALTILSVTAACADGSNSTALNGSVILNDQTQLYSVTSKTNTEAMNIQGDFVAQSVAGGNSLDVTTMQDSWVTSKQYTSAVDINSQLNANVKNIGGSVDLRSQAFCNDSNVSTDPTTTDVYNSQECAAKDPSASLNATAQNIGGDFQSVAVAMGNNFAEDTNAPNAPVQNYQLNSSGVYATNNTNVYNVKGSAAVVSSAIGNSAQIVHYSTDQ
ncbi:MAG TPA: hypothetical protein VHL34_05200 [Rhizomicrobium sp.]|jgi:hypothetical protein|nr:hypothetical protein [Rhizomicrobium sp.]